MTIPPFHLAFPVPSLESARGFFGGVLGCSEGRSTKRWIDFDFYGHQISAHVVDDNEGTTLTNPVDGDRVPCRHFGLILTWDAWTDLAEQLRQCDATFVIEPKIRFVGKPGEQATMFIQGPGENVIEFKSFRDPTRIFAT